MAHLCGPLAAAALTCAAYLILVRLLDTHDLVVAICRLENGLGYIGVFLFALLLQPKQFTAQISYLWRLWRRQPRVSDGESISKGLIIMALISKLRHFARTLATQVPILHQIRGTGAGRLLARISPIERITIDDTIVIELDLRVPQFRGYFFGNAFALESDLLLIPRLLSGDSVVVDIGAHIGVYALLAAKYAARVIAFEPAPETYRRMRANIALNPRLAPKIEVHQIALSDHPGC